MEYRNRRPENWPWPKLAASALPPPGRPWVLPPGGGSWLRRAAHPLPRTGWFGWSTPGCPLGAQTTPQQRHLTPGLGGSLCEAGRPAESLALSLGNGFWGEGMPTQNLPVLPDPVWENQVCPHHQGPRGNTHPSVIRSPPRWEALLPPALPVGRGRGTWPTEAGGPLVPWRGVRVGTPEPSPGPQRPSLPLQPPPHLGRWAPPAGLLARQTFALGTSLLHPALLGRPSLDTLTTEPSSLAAPSLASRCPSPRRQGLAPPSVLFSAARVGLGGGAPCNEPRSWPCSALGGPLCSLASRGQQLRVLGYWLWGAHLWLS